MSQKPLEQCSMGELIFARNALQRLLLDLEACQVEQLPLEQREAARRAQADGAKRLQAIHAEIARRTVEEISRQVAEEPAESPPPAPCPPDDRRNQAARAGRTTKRISPRDQFLTNR